MTVIYPTVFTALEEGGYMAYVPDLEINTQGEDLAEAIAMARDAIGITSIDREDDGKPLPRPSHTVSHQPGEIVSLVDVDLTAYRQSLKQKAAGMRQDVSVWRNQYGLY